MSLFAFLAICSSHALTCLIRRLQVNKVYSAHFGDLKPARSCVEVSPNTFRKSTVRKTPTSGTHRFTPSRQVAKLPLGVLVEVEAIASLPK